MAFTLLPVELNTLIAAHLDNDREVAAFASTCRHTHAAINDPASTLWRTLFAAEFDLIPYISNQILKAVYQSRRSLLRRGGTFEKGTRSHEKAALACLRDLILESYAGPKREGLSKNIEAINHFCWDYDLMHNVVAPRTCDKQTSSLILAVQVVLTHLHFDLKLNTRAYNFSTNQQMAYKLPRLEPLFGGKARNEVNMRWVLHTLTHFKHYMTKRGAALAEDYADLDGAEKIVPWQTNVDTGIKGLGKKWKGAYAYLTDDEVAEVRDGTDDEPEDRWCDNEDVFQSLQMHYADVQDPLAEDADDAETHQSSSAKQKMPWPQLFERHLRSVDHPSVKSMHKGQLTETKQSSPRPQGSRRSRRNNDNDSSTPIKNHSRTPSTISSASSSFSDSSVFSGTGGSPVLSASSSASDKSPPISTTPPSSAVSALKRKISATDLNDTAQLTPRKTRSQLRGKDIRAPDISKQTHLPRPTRDTSKDPLTRQFQASGRDGEEFLAAGWVSALPPQQEIPGWGRFTMMKFFENGSDTASDSTGNRPRGKPNVNLNVVTEDDGLWAYEGVILPGGRVIVGRWWHPESEGTNMGCGVALGANDGAAPNGRREGDRLYSGPFMFWCVDE